MYLFVLFSFALISAVPSALVPEDAQSAEFSPISIGGLFRFLHKDEDTSQYVRFVKVPRLTRQSSDPPGDLYAVGNRQAGDQQIANSSYPYTTWSAPQNAKITLNYPKANTTGYPITEMDCYMVCDNPSPDVYCTKGGIGYNYATIIMNCTNTKQFQHTTIFYGMKGGSTSAPTT